jgi:hypothetical protein
MYKIPSTILENLINQLIKSNQILESLKNPTPSDKKLVKDNAKQIKLIQTNYIKTLV